MWLSLSPRVRLHPRHIRGPEPGDLAHVLLLRLLVFKESEKRRLHSCGTASGSNRLRCAQGTHRLWQAGSTLMRVQKGLGAGVLGTDTKYNLKGDLFAVSYQC